MADNIPNPPPGAVPTKKTTGRVQPKKETVRINLPPKPSAAPTIKTPTLPPGGPSGAAFYATITYNSSVPEPGSLALLGSGVLAAASLLRRRLTL